MSGGPLGRLVLESGAAGGALAVPAVSANPVVAPPSLSSGFGLFGAGGSLAGSKVSLAQLRDARVVPILPRVLGAPPDLAAVPRELQAVLAVQDAAHAPGTQARRESALAEFTGWLLQGGHGATLATCTPEDVLRYVECYWVTRHPGRGTQGRPSPSAVHGVLSHLSTALMLLGRVGPYDSATGQGNPCVGVEASLYRRGYKRQAGAGGYLERSARPLVVVKYRALAATLFGRAQAAQGVEQVCLLRDLLAFQYMWATTTRGHDCGRLRLDDFRNPTDAGLAFAGFPLPLPGTGPLPTLVVRQLGTKTHQGERAPPHLLSPCSVVAECFVSTLALYQLACSQHGFPLCGVLFRPRRADQHGFEERPMSSSDLCFRLRTHLQLAGLYDGETCHSFRRGALQYQQAQGGTVDQLLGLSQLRSTATLQRYLDPGRHLVPPSRATG